MGLLESIIKSAATGGVKTGNLDLEDIIKSVGGQVAQKQSQGIDIGEVLGSVLGGQAKTTTTTKNTGGIDIGDVLGSVLGGQAKTTTTSKKNTGGIDIGEVLGSVLGGQAKTTTTTKNTGGIDLGSVLGSVLGGGSSSQGGVSDIAKSVINVLGMASGSLKK